ncbi:AraC family transcriptional regulator [Myroides sp. DF42-4-2]|uniref:helix-turn-helix domain-containing protein n=1 Tax=Myroides sp. DF42-4-2 TaxID=2746726 RepID=UPI0025769F73|nr:AraC family transcriptional regulator [Myroides sp. DF42-4-2]MDM1407747.1 helix-turn-helix transcriptional regulator [Myroides sp. DF42-4-2]
MAKENIYQALEVYYEKVEVCPLRNRQFNFFELVYVIAGGGSHAVNGNRIPFRAGDLFLITPQDCHEFDLEGICEFMVIRFGESYVKEYQWKSIDHIECLLYYASHLSASVLVHKEDKRLVAQLIQTLQGVLKVELMYNEDLIRPIVNAILVIAARNIAQIQLKPLGETNDAKIVQILNYIQQHIREPDLLKIAAIADRFGMSPTYLGSYFRKHGGESLQAYISAYKIRLIEHRLLFSDLRINEIAHEFGFADESHCNKFFKRHKGMSMSAFRKGEVVSVEKY